MSIRVVGSIHNTVNMSMELHFHQSFVPLRNPIKPTNRGLSVFRNISASVGESWGSPAVIPFPTINPSLRWKKIHANWRTQQFQWIVVAIRVSPCSWDRVMWIFSSPLEFEIPYETVWGTRCRSCLRHCATSRKVAGSIPKSVTGISHWHNPSDRTLALGLTQLLTEMSTRNISWGVKAAGV